MLAWAVYDKLNGVEHQVSAAIVRETAIPLASLIEFVGGKTPQLLSGYKIRILDGKCLENTDHRLEILRTLAAGALPGKSLVVLDPELRLAINVFACEDSHAQERSLFEVVLKTVKTGELCRVSARKSVAFYANEAVQLPILEAYIYYPLQLVRAFCLRLRLFEVSWLSKLTAIRRSRAKFSELFLVRMRDASVTIGDI